MWIGSHGLDVGAMGVMLYAFREREDLLDMYEAVSGARMHAAYYRPGGVYRDLPDSMPKYQPSKFRSQKAVDKLTSAEAEKELDLSLRSYGDDKAVQLQESPRATPGYCQINNMIPLAQPRVKPLGTPRYTIRLLSGMVSCIVKMPWPRSNPT